MSIEAYQEAIKEIIPPVFFEEAATIVEAHKPRSLALEDFEPVAQLDGDDPRFEADARYTPKEFLKKAEALGQAYPNDEEVQALVKAWKGWLENAREEAIITWQEAEDGTMVPVKSMIWMQEVK